MIKRRSIRIKVFQALYGYEHSNGEPFNNFSKQMKIRIFSIKEIYLFNLLMIQSIADALENEVDLIANKHIKKDADKDFNDHFLSNVFIKYLQHDETYKSLVTHYKLMEKLDDVFIQKLYRTFKESAEYITYIEQNDLLNVKEDLAIVKFLYKNIFLQSEDYHSYMQDIWSNWIDDAAFISNSVISTIEKSKSKLSLSITKPSFEEKLKELVTYADELLEITVNNKVKHMELIASKLKNWDVQRLASTDIYIIRMALAELLYFPLIPTKVTINEYIDIAKEYSTPKSKEFINGILDNLSKELMDKGLIIKEGRGLQES
jgi:N utilization substance protein B